MFRSCVKLSYLDLKTFTSSNVASPNTINTSYMFCYCNELQEINLSNLDTRLASNMGYMFFGCINLNKLTTGLNFKTSNADDLSYMFSGCFNIREIDLENKLILKEGNVNIDAMFKDCTSLETLKLGNGFDVKNTISMDKVFYNCNNLLNLDVKTFDATNLITMCEAFYNCEKIDGIKIINANKDSFVNIRAAFTGCKNLTTLDLSQFKINENVITTTTITGYTTSIAKNCDNLTTIKFGNNVTTFGKCSLGNSKYTYNINNGLFETSSSDVIVKTNIILPSDATDALIELVSPYDSETGTGYNWDADNRIVRIYKGDELLTSQWNDPVPTPEPDDDDDDSDSDNDDSSNNKKETKSSTTITVSTSSDSSSSNSNIVTRGYLNGYKNNNSTKVTFLPNSNISRAEMATIFSRIDTNFVDDKNYTGSLSKYIDTAYDEWYSNSVGFVTDRHIMQGYEDSSFKSKGYITRAELCCAICNYKNYNLYTALSYNGTLSDIEGEWYTNYVKTLCALGYINGYEDGTFKGNQPVTRAETCKILNKMLGINSSSVTKENQFSDIKESDWYYVDIVNASMN